LSDLSFVYEEDKTMKKSLLATSALVALASAALALPAYAADKAAAPAAPEKPAGFEVKVGGFMEQWFGYSDNANSAVVKADVFTQHSDDEFHLSFKQTLDNGITVGGLMEFEGEGAGGMDEQHGFLEGDFGKIILGAENNAPYLMHYSIKSNGIGVEEGDGGNVWIAGTGGASFTRTNVHLDVVDDNNTVTYLSPRVNGIQVGVSYTPEAQTDARVPAGTTAAKRQRNNNGVRDNAWGVAGNYNGTFADTSVKIAAGYTDGGSDEDVTNDASAITGAIQLGFGGFTVSVAYGSSNDDDASKEMDNFGASIAYNAGPAGVSLAYLRAEDSDGDDKQDQIEVGASYAVGAGVDLKASMYYIERVNDGSTAADGVAVAGGIVMNF
jgi:predicted porin